MSRFDTISTLEGFARRRGNLARNTIGIIKRLVIICKPIKKILICLVY
jgi:hypothetical protein